MPGFNFRASGLFGLLFQEHQNSGFRKREGRARTEWDPRISNFLETELKKKGVTCGRLAGTLADIDVDEKELNIKNKPSREKFSAVFLIQCLKSIGCDTLRLE